MPSGDGTAATWVAKSRAMGRTNPWGKSVSYPIKLNRPGGGGQVEGHGQDESLGVIGMLTDQIDAAGGAIDADAFGGAVEFSEDFQHGSGEELSLKIGRAHV